MSKQNSNQPTRLNKIAAYSALSCSFIGLHTGMSAQVVYTDINPDETLNLDGEFYLLDLNDDGISDYRFSLTDTIYPAFFVLASNSSSTFDGIVKRIAVYAYNGSVAGSEGSSGTLIPYALNEGIEINGTLQFQSNEVTETQYLGLYLGVVDYPVAGSIYQFTQMGNWLGMDEKYMGLKLIDDGNIYYGWARLSVNATNDAITLHDFAFEATPNTQIIAGDGISCGTSPEIVGAIPASPTSEKLKWTVETGIDYYQIYYRKVGTVTWSKKKANMNQKTISGLTCATAYEWKVRSNCAGTFSAVSPLATFTTAACRMDDMTETTEIALYPNPASDFIYVDFNSESTDEILLTVTDMSGRVIEDISYTNDEDMLILDTESLAPGLYIVSINQGGVVTAANFVKQ
ncbi:MAG: T9SS type A sorting domain-containing protein [Bacteroidetes bacterium]|nr:T9SS type A sorting domain-containing protein [Bacteroidota bacterium]